VVKNDIDTRECEINYQGPIVVGRFVQKRKPTYLEAMNDFLRSSVGEKFVPYQGPMEDGD
jgi:hypothetical protein